ncbi:MAG: hypothetical protein ACYC2Y_07260 [Armatimonadota bacterium]
MWRRFIPALLIFMVARGLLASPLAIQESKRGTSDLFFGSNSNGPYVLSWKPIEKFSERITVDGRPMQPGLDYELDYGNGILTFFSSVNDHQVVHVDYDCDFSAAVRNADAVRMPFELGLMRSGETNIKLQGLYTQAGQGPGMAVYGLSGNTKLLGMDLDTTFLAGSGGGDASFSEGSALRLNGKTDSDSLKLSTSYLKVGRDFADAKEFGMAVGMESLDLSAAYTPEGAPSLAVAHSQTTKDNDGREKTTTTDRVDIQHEISSSISATASHENVTVESGGRESKTEVSEFSVGARPSDEVSIDSRFTSRRSGGEGEQVLDLSVDANPSAALSVRAGMMRSDSDYGSEGSESLSLTARPRRNVLMYLDLSHADSEDSGAEFWHAFKVTATPGSDLSLELGMSSLGAEQPVDESSKTVKLSTTALRHTRIQLDWMGRESEVCGTEERTGVRVEASPIDAVRVAGAYNEVARDGTVVATVKEVEATARPVGFVDLSGGYKLREKPGEEALDSMSVSMRLAPGSILSLVGGYSVNPEDSKGAVEFTNNQTYGVESNMGRLKLRGAYTLKEEYLLAHKKELTEVGLDYRFSNGSYISTSYSEEDFTDSSVYQTSVYALTYRHTVGADMNIYLSGRAKLYEVDDTDLWDQADYQAEARVGLRF